MKEKEAHKKQEKHEDLVKWLSELSRNSLPVAGGKGANLAEMYNIKMPVPPAFVVTAQAYIYFLEKTKLNEKIKEIVEKIDVDDTHQLEQSAKHIRELIVKEELPKDLSEEIIESYKSLSVDKNALANASSDALAILKTSYEPVFVAVRSSATTEDLAEASFAGQQDTFLNVKGNHELLEAIKRCFASLFTARAVFYRKKKGFKHEQSKIAVVVQIMVNADKSGVIFSQDPVNKIDDVIIEAVFGLGEGIVSGKIKPDHYIVSRNLEIKERHVAKKNIAIVRNSSGKTEEIPLTKEKATRQVLSEYEVKRLADYSLQLEEHFKKPQDIEFAIDSDKIYIVQTRPITTLESRQGKEGKEIEGIAILSGLAASPGIKSGHVKVILDLKDLVKVKQNDILVTIMTNPDMVVTMQKAAAIVTDEGGITAHAAIVSREMGIPAVVGTQEATKKLKDGMIVTVNGFTGKVYEGAAEAVEKEILPVVETKTKIKVIVDLPSFAKRAAKTKAKGVGLMRLEGIIAENGKHPVFYLNKGELKHYTDVIYKGVSKIAEHFDELWVRTSDIRSDEYSNLEGAPHQKEANPMLGNHGIRFSLKNPELFKAELIALKKAAEHGKIIGVMMPQVIDVSELKETKRIIKELGFEKNIKLGIMVETPAAALTIEEFCKEGIDFISFGTNDLTQYTLAIDRGEESIQNLYNEMHPAVLYQLAHVIEICKKYNVETSICGQAGSKKEMARFLVEKGISSISVNADVAGEISRLVHEIESMPQHHEEKKEGHHEKIEHHEEHKKEIHEYKTHALMQQDYTEDMIKEELTELFKSAEEKEASKEVIEIPKLTNSIEQNIIAEQKEEQKQIKEEIKELKEEAKSEESKEEKKKPENIEVNFF
ncbi:phosphoenolpyruvate synthase [Candidatus Pacearchaeota archaeon]|nr:phosphoenolpyruvate synthase [Candidatus Pacearchaeota archaeon]